MDLGINSETLRKKVRQAEANHGDRKDVLHFAVNRPHRQHNLFISRAVRRRWWRLQILKSNVSFGSIGMHLQAKSIVKTLQCRLSRLRPHDQKAQFHHFYLPDGRGRSSGLVRPERRKNAALQRRPTFQYFVSSVPHFCDGRRKLNVDRLGR